MFLLLREVHGDNRQHFNLITDQCLSVNALFTVTVVVLPLQVLEYEPQMIKVIASALLLNTMIVYVHDKYRQIVDIIFPTLVVVKQLEGEVFISVLVIVGLDSGHSSELPIEESWRQSSRSCQLDHHEGAGYWREESSRSNR